MSTPLDRILSTGCWLDGVFSLWQGTGIPCVAPWQIELLVSLVAEGKSLKRAITRLRKEFFAYMLEEKGWIKLHRKSLHSTVWKNPVVWMVWSWCLMKANHKPCNFPWNGGDIELKEGFFVTGRDKAVSEIPISAQQWRTAITYLKSTNRITIKTSTRFTLVEVKKWKEYQQDNQHSNQPLTNEQPTDNHIQEGKNEKNERKLSASPSDIAPKPVKKTRDDEPMSLREFVDWCKASTQRHVGIIGDWADTVKPALETRGQWMVFIKRNLRTATLLAPFSDEQLKSGFRRLEEGEREGWLKKYTLETLLKFVT